MADNSNIGSGTPESTFQKIQDMYGVGKYKDKVTEDTDTLSKLPFSSLPKGNDPSPFSIGPIGGEK